jgi:hypothetical protein
VTGSHFLLVKSVFVKNQGKVAANWKKGLKFSREWYMHCLLKSFSKLKTLNIRWKKQFNLKGKVE